jgi:hypothetical protein
LQTWDAIKPAAPVIRMFFGVYVAMPKQLLQGKEKKFNPRTVS